ncbi:MAG: 2OG-Fe(II) oxygenase [Pseudomonadota bacterium]
MQLADSLDNNGQHDDAINELAIATQAGSLEAMTRLGKRLVVGDRAPYLPREGAGFILEAAQKGVAEAVALMALFQCTGTFQRQSWNDALHTLGHAAQLGWQSAQEQLLLLQITPDAAEIPGQVNVKSAEDWRRIVDNVDLQAWLIAPTGIVVNETPLLKSFPGFLPARFCKRLIAQSQHRLKPALVYDASNKRDVHSGTRTNSIAQFNLVETELLQLVLQERMANACSIPRIQFEAPAILHYKPGEQIMNHYDFVDTDLPDYDKEIATNGQRIITFLVYLNDDYENGATAFPKLGISHKGKAGEGFFFTNALSDGSPDHRVLHAGTPPGGSEKWIVSQFIRNLPIKYVVQP